MMRRVILILLTVILSLPLLHAQSVERDVIASGGYSYKSPTLQVDYTVGEAVIGTLSASGYTLTQGFHQPPLSDVSVPDTDDEIAINVYPNPFSSYIQVEYALPKGDKVIMELFDMLGKCVYARQIECSAKQVNIYRMELPMLSSGLYNLRISSDMRIRNVGLVKVPY